MLSLKHVQVAMARIARLPDRSTALAARHKHFLRSGLLTGVGDLPIRANYNLDMIMLLAAGHSLVQFGVSVPDAAVAICEGRAAVRRAMAEAITFSKSGAAKLEEAVEPRSWLVIEHLDQGYRSDASSLSRLSEMLSTTSSSTLVLNCDALFAQVEPALEPWMPTFLRQAERLKNLFDSELEAPDLTPYLCEF